MMTLNRYYQPGRGKANDSLKAREKIEGPGLWLAIRLAQGNSSWPLPPFYARDWTPLRAG